MAKLNRELTQKLFECKTESDVTSVIDQGYDLTEASRMAIDEVLKRIFNKTCTGLKAKAVEMLIGAVNGVDVKDEPVTPSLNPPKAPKSNVPEIPEEERLERIKNRVVEMVKAQADHFVRFANFKKDVELKMLGITEDDIKTVIAGHEYAVVGMDSKGKVYVMERNEEVMNELSTKWGDTFLA